MTWHRLFSSTIINRGYSYFRDGRVTMLLKSGDIYTGHVRGSHGKSYAVTAVMKDPDRPQLYCSCPFAAGGANRCKHEAALLYAIDAQKPAAKRPARKPAKKKQPVNPFLAEETAVPTDTSLPAYRADYHYFDLSRIMAGYQFSEEQCAEARALISDGRMRLNRVRVDYPGYISGDDQVLIVTGSYITIRTKRENEVRLTLSESRILDKSCFVNTCRGYYGDETDNDYEWDWSKNRLCVHELALLLLLAEYLKTNHVGDATDRSAMKLLSRFRRMRPAMGDAEEKILSTKKISLVPRFRDNVLSLSADFRIGTDKLYIVKDLGDLVKKVDAGESLPLGKTGSLDFSTHTFDECSQKYYDLIKAFVYDRSRSVNYRDSSYGTGLESVHDSEIPLYGERLDKIYDLTVGHTAGLTSSVKDMGAKANVFVKDRDLTLDLTITENIKNGRFEGICLTGKLPSVFRGVSSAYFIEYTATGALLCRMSQENLNALLPLAETGSREIDLKIGRRNLSDFYYHVLPVIEKYAEITEAGSEKIASFLPPEVHFKFYLDAGDEDITCRAEAAYGEDSYVLQSNLKSLHLDYGWRDRETERDAAAFIETLFPEYDEKEELFRSKKSDDAVYEILENGVSRLLSLGEVHSTDRFMALRIRKKWKLSVGVSVKSSIMEVDILSEDISPEELLDILKAYKAKKKYHRLKNGDFVDLSDENVEVLEMLLEAAHVSPKEFVRGKMQIPAYRALYLNKMLEEHEDITARRDSNFRSLIRGFKTARDSDFEVPASLRPVLRPYQVYGFKWMETVKSFGFGGILADDMGLGKTLQMIAVLLAAKEAAETGISLIVCPASLIYNWCEEFARFAPSLRALPLVGSKPERQTLLADAFRDEIPDVLVTSYDLLKRDIDSYEDYTFNTVVLDEAQYIKNPSSAAAKSTKIVKSAHRFALTGTPIENRLSELWSIFDFLMPGFLYDYETFRRELEVPITSHEDRGAAERLRKMVAPFILRRLKGDVLKDLPEKLEEVRYAAFEDSQRKLYDAQVAHMKDMLRTATDAEFSRSKIQILAELTRLRQVCCDPSLYVENYRGGSAKREALKTLVENAIDGGHKMLIFSQFTSMLALIEEDLREAGISYFVITGATPKEERMKLVKRFNNDDTPVFLISLKAGGTGLNLVGADIVIHYDPWWNLAVQNQATDRAHRIGQTRVVSVFKLIAKGTIEERIVEMQETKKDLADEILNSENGTLGKMTKEELLALLT